MSKVYFDIAETVERGTLLLLLLPHSTHTAMNEALTPRALRRAAPLCGCRSQGVLCSQCAAACGALKACSNLAEPGQGRYQARHAVHPGRPDPLGRRRGGRRGCGPARRPARCGSCCRARCRSSLRTHRRAGRRRRRRCARASTHGRGGPGVSRPRGACERQRGGRRLRARPARGRHERRRRQARPQEEAQGQGQAGGRGPAGCTRRRGRG
jgi:hypothetical protein